MNKEKIALDVRDTELVNILNILNILYRNGYEYVIVHRPRDARPIYKIEAHMGVTE